MVNAYEPSFKAFVVFGVFSQCDFLSCLLYYNHSKAFARFILENRKNSDSLIHSFDFVIGVMSDSNPVGELIKLRNGELSEEEVIQSFMKGTSMEQLSLHTQDLCDRLILKKVTCVTDGKELDIDDIKKGNDSK